MDPLIREFGYDIFRRERTLKTIGIDANLRYPGDLKRGFARDVGEARERYDQLLGGSLSEDEFVDPYNKLNSDELYRKLCRCKDRWNFIISIFKRPPGSDILGLMDITGVMLVVVEGLILRIDELHQLIGRTTRQVIDLVRHREGECRVNPRHTNTFIACLGQAVTMIRHLIHVTMKLIHDIVDRLTTESIESLTIVDEPSGGGGGAASDSDGD